MAKGARCGWCRCRARNRFEQQDDAYKESVLPAGVTRRVAVEAGVRAAWWHYVGSNGTDRRHRSFRRVGAGEGAVSAVRVYGRKGDRGDRQGSGRSNLNQKGFEDDGNQGGHQWLRANRPQYPARAVRRQARRRHQDRRHQRFGRCQYQCASDSLDTVHGRFHGDVHVDGDSMVVNGDRIRVVAQRDPTKLPWGELGVDFVLECTGLFTSKAKASAHIAAGAKKVVISAPGGDDVDATIVYGVNHGILKSSHSRDFQCLLHHQLPGAAGEGAARKNRCPGGRHEHHSFLHQRPGIDGCISLRSAPRALRDHVDDSDQDRRRRGRGLGHARTQGQDRRLLDPGADHQRVACGLHLQRGPQDHRGGNSTAPSRRPRRALSMAFWLTTINLWCRWISITIPLPPPTTRP